MRHLLIGTLALTLTFPPLPAQKIDTETPSRERVVRVQTAMNHLTVIEVAEPVTTVAVGSPQAFKVERRENKVFIQPLQENVSTNLFIWTASTRLNYELVPAISDAGQMDLAIDYRQPQPQAQLTPPKPPEPTVVAPTVPSEMLLNSTPVRLVGGAAAAKADLGVLIRDVYRRQDEVFVRFSIENRSSQTLRAGTPAVVSLTGLKFDRSLWAFQNAQLGMEYASRLKTYDAPIPVKIRQCEPGVAEVGPGEARIGLIALQLPPVNPDAKKTQPTVLKILFPIDRTGNLTATLVL
jgi:Conjugal transfer protein